MVAVASHVGLCLVVSVFIHSVRGWVEGLVSVHTHVHVMRGSRAWRACVALMFAMGLPACATHDADVDPTQLAVSSLPPNILVITVDDMNTGSVGVFGSQVDQITPSIDALANEGIRFSRAHVQVANCMPSRNVMWSGLYPHTSGVEGFVPVPKPGYKSLGESLHSAGYFTAIRHKVNDSTPYTPFPWDSVLDQHALGGKPHKKDSESYGLSVSQGIALAAGAEKPFFLLVNIADPHLPYYGFDRKGNPIEDPYVPSRVYTAEEVEVPGFLPDLPEVREELARYFSSVRRADDAVGHILAALERSGEAGNTLVMFVSDHGMPFPFAKTQLYHHSTSTPLVLRWPNRISSGSVNNRDMVSAIDFMPTLLDATDTPLPDGLQGHSFLDLLLQSARDKKDESARALPRAGINRDYVIKEYNQNSGWQRAPMRAVQSKRYLYVFNAWANGTRELHSATLRTDTFRAMEVLANADEAVADRVRLLKHRTLEEFYDVEKDPDCLLNLIDEPEFGSQIESHRLVLDKWMMDTEDHAREAFLGRTDPEVLAAYMKRQNASAIAKKRWYKSIKDSMSRKRSKQN